MGTNPKKIAFCITCMNRLHHLQQALEKNIHDNYLPKEVEFVLLDYNSKDGLDQWVRQNMQSYIDSGILVYYKTFEPEHYLRSHSRNMVFRLANADILCNLDADNFLGKGFADFMLDEFSKYGNFFYTNNFSVSDIIGRVCVRSEDFLSIRGYNETLKGYGPEDVDLFNRLRNKGLNQLFFHNPEFYHFIVHSKVDRITNEFFAKNIDKMYISYINPYTSAILLLYKDHTMEHYVMVDNPHLNVFAEFAMNNEYLIDERNRVVIKEDLIKGTWNETNDVIYIYENNVKYKIREKLSSIDFNGLTFYNVQDNELKTEIIILLTSAINYYEACKQMKDILVVNPDGFGKGVVFKNFNLSKKIILS